MTYIFNIMKSHHVPSMLGFTVTFIISVSCYFHRTKTGTQPTTATGTINRKRTREKGPGKKDLKKGPEKKDQSINHKL